MMNQQIIEKAVKEKIMGMTLHAIVNECFINALPFDQEDISSDDKYRLTAYSKEVLESLINDKGVCGGVNQLTLAMESTQDPRRRQFLESIYTICNETSTKVSKRIAKDGVNAVSLEEILDNAGLNEDEISEFKENVSTLNPEKISEVIQTKVVDTIKAEQEEHAEAEKLNAQIKEVVSPVPDPDAMEGTEEANPNDEDDEDGEKKTNDGDDNDAFEDPDTADFDNDIDDDSDDDDDDDDKDEDDDDDDKKKKKKKDDEDEDEAAEEGFFGDWRERRRLKKLSKKEIMNAPDELFATLAAELVVQSPEDVAKIINDEDQIIQAFRKCYWCDATGRDPKLCPEPRLFRIPLGIVDVPVVVFVDCGVRAAAIMIYDRGKYDYETQQGVGSFGGELGSSVKITTKKKDPNERNHKGNIMNFDLDKVYSIEYNGKQLGKRANRIYQKNYRTQMLPKDPAAEALTNWYRYRFNKLDVTSPTSLFGKIEDFAMEALLRDPSDDEYSEIPFNALKKVTFEAPLRFIYTEPSLDAAVESLLETANTVATESAITTDTCDKSMLISTIVYTILETLKTLNIYCPSKPQIQATVNTPTSNVADTHAQLEIAKDQLEKKVMAIPDVVKKAKTKEQLSGAIESVNYCREVINALAPLNKIDHKLIDRWDMQLENSTEAAKKKMGVSYIATESAIKMEEKRTNDMIRELDKINRYYGIKPNIDIIEIHYNSAAQESYVPDVIVRDNSGRIIDKSFLDISIPPNFGLGMENLLLVNYPRSKIADTNKLLRMIDHGRNNYTQNIE